MVLSRPEVLSHPALCQKRCAACFCFPRKNVFLRRGAKRRGASYSATKLSEVTSVRVCVMDFPEISREHKHRLHYFLSVCYLEV